MMSATDTKLLDTFGELIPKLPERDKDRLLAYAEGMVFMAGKLSDQKEKEETE